MALLARRDRAEVVLDREYEDLRRPTLAALRTKLGTRNIHFDDVDLEAFYNQAWHGLYLRLAEGDEVENHGGFLVHAGYCRAIEEVRRLHPERRAEGVDLAAVGADVDLPAQLDDHMQLRHFMEGMRDRLSERERAAVTLCYIQGCSRPEAAELLGVSSQRMEKLMDGASRKVGVLVSDIQAGSWCDSRESLMKAYAFGVLDPDGERWALADAHLQECSGCRGYVRGLRGIAAVAPPVGLTLALLGALGLGAGVAGATGGAGAGAGAGAGGAAAGAGGAGGGIGTAGIAAAASIAVAAGGFGAYQVASHSGKDPAKTTTPVVTAAPATTRAVPAAPTRAKVKAKRRPARKQPAAPAPVASSPSTTSAAPAPASTRTTTDGAQEFGFEH
jgi:DNA-directed RNA polymerase specialized sigma24 family protein